ncbi:EAL domain-containing protein [Acinetobacter sp. HY1485]|uniref:EAL domain-containing protein n=1 Tax=Acinetobacter sp. HY1485 TaxID=2970918 RepID=UPI0022B945AD|nr:EAL domain-containing protein [Acinetobacter sp. HY1485]
MPFSPRQYQHSNAFAVQIRNTLRFLPYFITGTIMLISCISLQLHHFFMYLLASLTILIGLLVFSKTLLIHQSQNRQHQFIKITVFIIGLIMGGIQLLAYTSFLFLMVYAILSLIFLTQRLTYFLINFIPALLPLVVVYPLDFHLFFLAIIATAIPIYTLQSRLTKTTLKYQNLLDKKKRQATSKNNIIKKLQNNHQQLQERLENLEITRCQTQASFNMVSNTLQKQNSILSMTNNLTPVKTWEWDMVQSIFKATHHEAIILRNDTTIEKYLEGVIHPDDIDHVVQNLKRYFLKDTEFFKCEYRIKNNVGDWIWISSIGQIIQWNTFTHEPLYMVGVFHDIEVEKKAQGQIEYSSNILQHIDVGVVTLDQNLCYVEANPFFYKMTGLEPNAILNKKIFEIADNYRPQQRSLHFSITDQILKKAQFTGEFEEHFTHGNTLYIRCHINAIRDHQQNIVQYVGIFSDLTQYRQQEKRLSYLENHDVITNLPNRFAYNYKTYEFFISHQNSVHQIAIIRLGIDRFNALHAFLGNQATSTLLKKIAQRLRISNPNAFIIAYLNREDFVLVYELNHIQPSIQSLCEQILESFKAPFSVEEHELILTLSIGVAIYPDHSQNFETLNQQAQQALNHAQQLGGDSVQYYSTTHKTAYLPDIHLENELHRALKNNELELYYQPKIDTQQQRIFGFETLIRWNHPTKGILLPDQFLPAAQQTSIISEIGQYVLKHAIIQLKKWQNEGLPLIQLSINIDAQQLYRGQLLTHLDHLLAKYNINGQYLEFEMTESSLIENTDYVQRVLQQIKVRQIKLALDDFGKGYSSLGYLTEFPFDVIKIDKQFVQDFENPRKNAILNAIIAMGTAMGLTLIAEGVETQEQLAYLQSKQCHIIQGYLFSKPLKANDATYFMQNFHN